MTENNVQLPDEYDTIFHDLEPFWGIQPHDLHRIRDEMELIKDTYTLARTNGTKIDVVKYAFQDGSYEQLIRNSKPVLDLFRDIEEFLPPLRAVFSPHDAPTLLSDYGVKAAALRAAQSELCTLVALLPSLNVSQLDARILDIESGNLPKINNTGWVSACPPSSPARRISINLDAPPPPSSQKTFIHDHRSSMDPCLHPELFYHHGQFVSHELGPAPQREMVPLFSFCSTTVHHNIRIPTTYGWIEDLLPRADDPDWNDKLEERLGWRGSNTGIWHANGTRWRQSHRNFLVSSANELNGTTRVLLPTKSGSDQVGAPKEMRNSRLNPAIFDIFFAGKPLACEEAICRLLETMFTWKKRQGPAEAGNYKYILDVGVWLLL